MGCFRWKFGFGLFWVFGLTVENAVQTLPHFALIYVIDVDFGLLDH